MTRWCLLALLAATACACPGKHATAVGEPGSGGSASGSAADPGAPATCAGIRAKVEALYRAEAQRLEPTRVEAAVADNTTMVMNDCARDAARVAPCVARVTSVVDLEHQCLIPLEPEGTEGKELP